MEDEVYVESSTRSIIILGLLYDGVCLECLAMHSKSFAIIKLCLIFPYSAALLVFLSNHKTSDKEDNCRMKLCSSNVSWDSTDCKIMAFFNSRGSQFHGSTYEIRKKNAMDLNEIRAVLDVIAIKRMSRAGKGFLWSHHPFKLSNTLKMLRLERVLCIIIAAYPDKIWDCIGCLIKNVRDTRLADEQLYGTLLPAVLSCFSCFMYEKSFFTKSPTSSFQKLLSCHDGRKCIRLQIFSDNFCSDRAVFRSVGSSQSISRADVIKTTILVGVWPPQKSVFFHGTIRNRTRIRFGPKSFPRLDEDYGCVR
ncbi:unnamed protein product [Albugo candida]|uniref:Uncharacterized protein n=1 Tax=Albugo candida TaxID=65357 RepID=A0A024FXH3_9STRA|nr:unnamed protein product [Albugo candida]|eukprot:CCI11359.1 unnamed protein product [Albugo candida]